MNQAKVKRLIDRVDRRKEERDRELASTQAYRDRTRAIRDAKNVDVTGFWCADCKRDFQGVGIKQIREPAGMYPIAWYRGTCPRGHQTIRYITDKDHDPFYFLSVELAHERARLDDDLLQPSDPRFRLVYPDKWASMERQREENERLQANH